MSQHKENANVSPASSTTSMTSEIATILVSETLERAAANVNELMQSISRWEAEERSKSEADDNKDKSSAACRTHQKVERQLQRFFGLRRVFAEHQGETLEDTVTQMDSTTGPSGQEGQHVPATFSPRKSCDFDKTDEKSVDRHGNKIFKKMKSVWKRCFGSKPVQVAEEQDLDETVWSDGSDSKSGSPYPEETSPTASIGSCKDIRAAEKADLLTDIDGTPGPSLVLPGAEHVDEAVGSTSSNSTSKGTNLTKPGSPFSGEMSFTEMDAPSAEDDKDVCQSFLTASTLKHCDSDRTEEKSAGRNGSKIYKKMKSAWKHCFKNKPRKNVQPAEEEQDLDETDGSEGSDLKSGSPYPEETSPTASMCSSEDIRDATKADLSSVPLDSADVDHMDITTETENVPSTLYPTGSSQPADHHEQRSAVMEEDLVTNMDSPPEQDGHLEPSQVHLGAEQYVDGVIRTASSDLTSGSASPKEMSPTALIGSCKDIGAAEKADLLTDIDGTPGPSLVLPGAEHVDEAVGSTSSDSTSKGTNLTKPGSPFPGEMSFTEMDAPFAEDDKDVCQSFLTASTLKHCDSDRTEEKSAGRNGSKIYKKMKSAWKHCFKNKPRKNVQPAEEQDLDETDGSEGNDLKSGSPYPEETSPTASMCSSEDIRDATKADLSSVSLDSADVDHMDITTETENVPSTLYPTGSSQPADHHEQRSAVMDEDLVTNMDSPPEQDGHIEPSQVHLGAEQYVDGVIRTASSDLTSGSASPKEMSPTASIGSCKDIGAAEKADLLTDMDGTPGPSLVLPGAEHVDEAVGSTSSNSTSKGTNLTKPGSPFPGEMSFTEMDAPSAEDDKDVCQSFLTASTLKHCDSDRTEEKSAGRNGSKIYKKMKSAWKHCFKNKPRKNVQLAEEQDLDETVRSDGSESKSDSPCPEETSPTASIGSCKDIRAAEKVDLSSVPLELADVDHMDITTETENVLSTLSPTGSSQPVHNEQRSAVMDEDLVTNMDSPPEQDGHIEPSQVHLGAEQYVDGVIRTASSDLTSGSASPKEMSPTASVGSCNDIRAAEKADLLTDIDGTPGPSLVLPGAEHVDEAVGSTSSDSTSKGTNLTKPGSPFPGEMSFTEMDAPFAEDDKDVCQSFLTASTLKHCDSDRTEEKSAGRNGSKIYKKMKSAWKHCFKNKPRKNVQPAEEQDLDETDGSEGNDLKSGSPYPEETSPTASMCSSEDIRDATKADLSSVPLDSADVDHMDITTETENVPSTLYPTGSSQPADHHEQRSSVMDEDLVTNMDSPPEQDGHLEPSQVHLGAEQCVDGVIRTASCDLTSGSSSPKEMSPTASICLSEDIKGAETADLSPVPLVQDNDVTPEGVIEELMEDNLVKDMDAAPGSSLDSRAATKVDLSSVPLELVDVEDEYVTPEEEDDVSKPSTTSSSPPPEHDGERSSVTEKDLVIYSDSTLRTSGQDRHLKGYQEDNGAAAVAQLTGLRKAFYTIIQGFFDRFSEEQRRDISKGVCSIDVKENLADLCVEVLELVIETITDILSKAIYQFAPQYGTLTSSQGCGTEAVGQKLPSEIFRENFDITEENIQQSLKGSFGKAFCDVVDADTSVSITPEFTEAIVERITDEVNSILSETIQASLDGESSNVCAATCCLFSRCIPCKEMLEGVIQAMKSLVTGLGTTRKKTIQTVRTQKHSDHEREGDTMAGQHTIKVHQKKLPWWSCVCKWRKTKVHVTVDEQESEAVRLPSGHKHFLSSRATSNTCSVSTSKLNSTPLEFVDYLEDEDITSEETGKAPSSYSIGWFPQTCLEDEVIVPDYQESPSLSETQTEVRGFSCHQSGDSGDGNCHSDVGTEEVLMAASDTDVTESQAERSNINCCIFRKGKNKEDAAKTKRPSLLKRIRLICCRQSCCSHDDVTE